MRFTQDTSGKLAAFKTFSSPLWLLRNMGRELLLSIYSNAEIAPPIEGLSSSRNAPDLRVSIVPLPISDIFLTCGFTRKQLRWG